MCVLLRGEAWRAARAVCAQLASESFIMARDWAGIEIDLPTKQRTLNVSREDNRRAACARRVGCIQIISIDSMYRMCVP